MPKRTPAAPIASARGRIASLSRSRTTDDPDFIDAKRDLAAAKIADYIERVSASAPPLTEAQRERLAALFGGAV